jgi:hypothetical protein
MKTKSFLLLLAILTFGFVTHGQSVTITKQRVSYKRLKPNSPEKAKIVIHYPRIRSANRALSRRIERNISFAKVVDLNLADEIKSDGQWLESAWFDVNYNKKGILSITLSMSGSGHFSSTISRSVVVDLKTGRQVKSNDVFDNMDGLAKLVFKYQQAEIEQAMIDIPKMEGYGDFDSGKWFGDMTINFLNLQEFIVSDEGVTFKFDYGFPRIMLPAQPPGIFLIKWHELKPFISRLGLLGKLVY